MSKILIVGFCAALLSACGPDPALYIAADDPSLAHARAGYRSVTGGVRAFNVTGPGDWVQSNQAVTPQEGAHQGTAEGAKRGR